MRRLFAGWRIKYIEAAPVVPGCLFCALRKKGDDVERYILERGKHAFVVLNAFPYTTGHVMVAANRHVGTLHGLKPDESADVWRLAARAERAILRAYRPEGMNAGVNLGRCAGAGVEGHLHLHLVPRWPGDTNFMTSVAETRVIPEELSRTYERLRQALRARGR
jgi:ATP adenylyltransferase